MKCKRTRDGDQVDPSEEHIKFTTPQGVLCLLIESDEAVLASRLKLQIAHEIAAIKSKITKCSSITYLPDTRICKNCEETLSIFRDTLERVRMTIADYIKSNFDCEVILTQQPTSHIPFDYVAKAAWSPIHGRRTCIKFKKIASLDLISEIPEALNNHPHILFEQRRRVGQRGVMVSRELIEDNFSSADKLKDADIKVKLQILLDALKGSIFLRDCGYIHCDIKPSNIFVTIDSGNNEMTGMIGDLEGILQIDPTNTLPLPIATRVLSEDYYYKYDTISIDEARDSFSWAFTIALLLNPAIAKSVGSAEFTPAIWFAEFRETSQYFDRLINLLERGFSYNRADRPAFEEYQESLLEILEDVKKIGLDGKYVRGVFITQELNDLVYAKFTMH